MYVDHCEVETTLVETTLRGPILLDLPVSNIGDIVDLQWDSCEDVTALGGNAILRNASRICVGTFPAATWEEIHFIQAEGDSVFTSTTRKLCDVASVSDSARSQMPPPPPLFNIYTKTKGSIYFRT